MGISLNALLGVAKSVAADSKCASMQVGAVLVIDGHIVSTGINGTPKGYTNCNELFSCRCPEHSVWSEKYEIHAEMNCIIHCPTSTEGGTIVVTHAPCWNCAKHIVASGITSIYYGERYYRMPEDEFKAIEEFCADNKVIFEAIDG